MSVDLDDAPALIAADPDGMLRAVASGAAQVREALVLAEEAGLSRLAGEGLPRAVVVCGMGGSAMAGEVLTAVAGAGCRVPVVVHRAPGLPAWVGAADLVLGVSCSGSTQETVSAVEEAVRRGCRLLVVAAAGSPLESLARRGRGLFVPTSKGRPSRASLWALSVPLLVAGQALGLLGASPEDLEEAATVLEEGARRCRPDADSIGNPAKALATELSGALPVVWGASALAGAAAHRFAAQLNLNAGAPATWGVLPEVAHDQLGVLDGAWAAPRSEEDLFADRLDEPARPSLRMVLLREVGEVPATGLSADVVAGLAAERGVGVSALLAEGTSAVARLASLIGVTDFASVYLALAEGTDPTPVAALTALKGRTQR